MSQKTDSRYSAIARMINDQWIEKRLPFWTNTQRIANHFEISKPTAWRLLEDTVKTGLMFKVQYKQGTFTYSNYMATFYYAKIGGVIPYTHLKHAKAWLAGGLLHGELESICGGQPTPERVKEVYESWERYQKLKAEG